MASFLVHSTMRLAARTGLFLVGEIKDGKVRAGMTARLGRDAQAVSAPILGIEFLDYPGGISHVALHLELDDSWDTDAVTLLCAEGSTIDVV